MGGPEAAVADDTLVGLSAADLGAASTVDAPSGLKAANLEAAAEDTLLGLEAARAEDTLVRLATHAEDMLQLDDVEGDTALFGFVLFSAPGNVAVVNVPLKEGMPLLCCVVVLALILTGGTGKVLIIVGFDVAGVLIWHVDCRDAVLQAGNNTLELSFPVQPRMNFVLFAMSECETCVFGATCDCGRSGFLPVALLPPQEADVCVLRTSAQEI